jgi:hypothetical protein
MSSSDTGEKHSKRKGTNTNHSMCIRVQKTAGFSSTHILQEVPTNFHSVLVICVSRNILQTSSFKLKSSSDGTNGKKLCNEVSCTRIGSGR